MNDFHLIFSSLAARKFNNFLSVLLTGFGVMLAVVIIMFGQHIQNRFSHDGQGIDLVIGAKGSPLQIILSSVYHIDIPTGNIPYEEAQKWMHHPQVKFAVPLALGDNYRGMRIVGTTRDYIALHHGKLVQGNLWNSPFEAVAGAQTGLSVGDEFSGAHGLIGIEDSDGHHHQEHYKITGVLAHTGTVLDRLIITSVDSVLKIHGFEEIGHDEKHDEEHAHEHEEPLKPEITAVLLKMKSPVAIMNFPHLINRETMLQAANPSLEMARLSVMLGLGSRTLGALAGVLIIVAGLSIFSGLAGNFQNRAFDLAVLRAVGFTRGRLMRMIVAEGAFITILGIIFGVLLGFGAFYVITQNLEPLRASGARPEILNLEILWVVFTVFLAGVMSAMIPAWQASRLDVAAQLSKGI